MKYIILTGSNGGIGCAIRQNLLHQGYYVYGLDIKDDGFQDKNYQYYSADVTQEDEIKKIKEEILKKTSEVYAIINASGIFMMEPVAEGDIDHFKKIMDINVLGPMIVNKTFIPLLLNQGRIINITSEVGRYSPQPFNGYYALSKITLDKYNDILRRECAYIGIKVIKIQSGAIKTHLLGGVNTEYDALLNNTAYFKAPLTKLKYMMDREINKQTDPRVIVHTIDTILKAQHPHRCYKVKNSKKLSFLNGLPEGLQDYIYRKVIK